MSVKFTQETTEEFDIYDHQMHLVETRQNAMKYCKELEIQEAQILQDKLDDVKVVLHIAAPEFHADEKFIDPREVAFQRFDDAAMREVQNRIQTIKHVKELMRKKKTSS